MKLIRVNETNVINADQIVFAEHKKDGLFLQMANTPGFTVAADENSERLWGWLLANVEDLERTKFVSPPEPSLPT